MGAAYVMTGSVNQACVESGTSTRCARMLAEAGQADVAMAPAADMFEMGVKVQVLERGTMFPMRAAKLYELYRSLRSLDEIPAGRARAAREDSLQAPLEDVWARDRGLLPERDPASRAAERDRSTRWRSSSAGTSASRPLGHAADPAAADYQVWCGPAMGAFNDWVRGTWLEPPLELPEWSLSPSTSCTARPKLNRANFLRSPGIDLGRQDAVTLEPLEIAPLKEYSTSIRCSRPGLMLEYWAPTSLSAPGRWDSHCA